MKRIALIFLLLYSATSYMPENIMYVPTVTDEWNTVVRLSWTHALDAKYYIIKQNGIRVGNTTANRYFAHYLTPATSYTFEVVKVNKLLVETSLGTVSATTTIGVDYAGAEPKIINAGLVSPAYNITDATLNYRAAITSANIGDIVNFKNTTGDGNWRIGDNFGNQFTRFNTANDITILFDPGVQLTAINGTWANALSMLMRFDHAKGVRILGYGAEFYLRSTSFNSDESRMSIAFYNSQECWVEGLKLDGSGGDGIYFGNLHQGVAANAPAGFSLANERMGLYNLWSLNHKRVAFSHDGIDGLVTAHLKGELTGAVYANPNLFGWSYENNYAEEALSNIVNHFGYSRANNYSGVGLNLTKGSTVTPDISIEFFDFVLEDNWVTSEANSIAAYNRRRDFHSSYAGPGGIGQVNSQRLVLKGSPATGFGFHTLPSRITYDFKDLALIDPVNSPDSGTNEFHAVSVMQFSVGAQNIGDFTLDGVFAVHPKNQSWLSFQGSNDTNTIHNTQISNARIVTPFTGTYYNPQSIPQGSNTSIVFTQQTTAPTVTVSVSSTPAVRGGDYGSITFSRNTALNHPTPVEVVFSGATEFDDYDFLPPIAVIPANELSVTWPIKAMYQVKGDNTLTTTIQATSYYTIGTAATTANIQAEASPSQPPSTSDQQKARASARNNYYIFKL